MSKILIIEDDLALAEFVKDFLEAKLHEVDHVADGLEGLAWLQQKPYAAAIIDWQLPGLSGIEICQKFRKGGGKAPIIMLTAKKGSPDVVDGLSAGADDYVTKPFEISVLYARLQSVLRRAPSFDSRTLIFNDIELDLDGGVFRIGEATKKLTRKELGILELLMRNPGRVFSADAILEHVWSTDSETGPETVRTHINHLRKSLAAASPTCGDIIESVYGLGYRLKHE
ncbi:MAG: response regulator transcription factor [Candidatus Obscuribacterales bacterium]|nr:response regulator transcription factor [Candidatus Obscuribacterales bacterium]